MKKTGASLIVYALEQLPIKFTFGIPGVHNTELYDELSRSKKIRPMLVTHEGGGAFMAEGISRTSDFIGTLVIVPAAGITHAMSGIGEAFLDGIPMLIISGGIRRDTGRSYQLHDIDQHKILAGITKKTYLIQDHKDIVPTIFEAYHLAIAGEPGPVFIEVPVNVQLFEAEVGDYKKYKPLPKSHTTVPENLIQDAVDLLIKAKHPGIFLGWGAKDSTQYSIEIAEILQAPVATTLQGFSVFPGNHPLHTGMGFSEAAVPAASNAFKNCDCLLAVGTRFAEIPTGSFGAIVPENLIHIDINGNVFNKNYPVKVAIEGDAFLILQRLAEELKKIKSVSVKKSLHTAIAKDKKKYLDEWKSHLNKKVNPAYFFQSLRKNLSDDAIIVVDDGNHTFLAAELFTSLQSKSFISPTDFNCMGYCVPAAIGAKLVNPDKQVVGIVGDGAFLMTCMEIITASREKTGVVYFVFNDGELSQISQGQQIPYNRKTCTVLPNLNFSGLAKTVGAKYLEINSNSEIDSVIAESLNISTDGSPVIVNVKIDYSKRTRFTKGVVKTVAGGFPLTDKIRIVGRAVKRKITG
jgi:acetolactate synthase-1/2/3 large subunit